MSFRRRRGLGSRPDDGDGAGGPRRSRAQFLSRRSLDRLRRWGFGAAVVVAAAGAGYLVAAELLFPAASPAEAETLVDVPSLRGVAVEEARTRLRESGLSLRVAGRIPVGDLSEGRVLAQRPLGGQQAGAGDTVSVTLSAPEGELRVPALRALREERARSVLRQMGFRVDTAREPASVPRGEVVGTAPPAGEVVAPGARVRVILSEGPPVSGVPALVGRHLDDVRPILADSGLALGSVSYDTAAFAAPGRVVAQSPPPGFSLREGERVAVRVAGPPRTPPGAGAVPDSSRRR